MLSLLFGKLFYIVWLLELLDICAPADLPQYMLIVIKCVVCLEILVAREVPSVVGLTFKRHHLLPRKVNFWISHQFFQFVISWRHHLYLGCFCIFRHWCHYFLSLIPRVHQIILLLN